MYTLPDKDYNSLSFPDCSKETLLTIEDTLLSYLED